MEPIDFDTLDNPVGNSVRECHSQYGLNFQNAHFYLPEYCPFGDFSSFENAATILEQYAQMTSSFYIHCDHYDHCILFRMIDSIDSLLYDQE